MRSALTFLVLALIHPAVPIAAQGQEIDTDVPQTFWIEGGGFRASGDSNLRLSGGGEPGDDIGFEGDLEIPGVTNQFYLEGFWRPGRRHLVSLSFTRLQREGSRVTLDEEIRWGDEVFRVGAQAQGKLDSDFLSGAYRFALFKNETFEIGPALGIGYVSITAKIRGEASLESGGDTAVREVEVVKTAPSITGDVGGYLQWWPGRRWLVRGDARYIFLGFEESEASVAEGRASLTWYAWRQVGLGAQYIYTRFRYQRGLDVNELGGEYQYDGLQIFVNVAF